MTSSEAQIARLHRCHCKGWDKEKIKKERLKVIADNKRKRENWVLERTKEIEKAHIKADLNGRNKGLYIPQNVQW